MCRTTDSLHVSEVSLEEDLRLSEVRHRLLAERANDVIWTMGQSAEATLTSVSKRD